MSSNKALNFLFSLSGAFICGVLIIAGLIFLIRNADSVHAFDRQPVREFYESPRLHLGAEFSQWIEIPDRFDGRPFILALFFGRINENSTGGVSVTLSQEETVNNMQVASLQALLIQQKRLRFEGFKAGPALLQISGPEENSPSSPSLIYLRDGQGSPLQGPGIPKNAFAYLDWYFIMEGQEKLETVFPSIWSSMAWLLPFVVLIAIAIRGMRLSG